MPVNIGPKIQIDGEAEYRKQLKGIVEQTKTLDSEMKKLESTFNKDTSVKEKNRKKAELLVRQQENLQKQVDECKKAVDHATAAYGENSTEALKWKQALNNAETQLNSVNSELENVTGINAWKAGVDELAGKLDAVSQKMESAGKGLTTHVTAPIMAVGAASIAAFNEVDEGLDIIVTKTGATGDTLESLQDSMKTVFGEMAVSAADAGTAVGDVNTRFGLVGDELAGVSETFLKFAQINDTDVSTAINSVDGIMAKFGVDASDVGLVLDAMTAAGQATGISMDTLESSLSTNGATLKEMGFDLEGSINLLAQMEANGVDTSTAMAGLKKAVSNATSEGKTANQALAETIDSIKNAETETDALAIATEVFGTKGAAEMTQAIREGRLSVDDLSVGLSNYAGVVETTFANTQDAPDQATIALNNLKLAGADLGDTMLTAATPAIEKITEVIKTASEWFQNLDDDQKKTIITIAGIVAAIGPALLIGGQVVGTISKITSLVGSVGTGIQTLSPMVTKIGGLIGGLNPTMLLVAGGIAAAIAAGVLLYQNWDTIKEKAGQLKDAVTEKFNSMKEKMSQTWDSIKEKGTVVMDTLTDITDTALGDMQSAFEENGGGIRGAQAALMAGLNSISTQGFNKLDSLTGGKLSKIKDTFTTTFNNAKSIVTNALSSIKSAFANSTFKLPSIKMPHFSWSWMDIGGIVKIPKISISWYAKAMEDGMILNRPTIFGASGGSLLGAGEAGSETVVGTSSLISMIRQAVQEGMGYAPGDTNNYGGVTVNVYGAPGQDVEELADLIEERLTANVIRREAAWT